MFKIIISKRPYNIILLISVQVKVSHISLNIVERIFSPSMDFALFFVESGEAFCGNGIVEQGEECDCGYEEECTDVCSNPRRTGGQNNDLSCTRKINPNTYMKYECRYVTFLTKISRLSLKFHSPLKFCLIEIFHFIFLKYYLQHCQ